MIEPIARNCAHYDRIRETCQTCGVPWQYFEVSSSHRCEFFRARRDVEPLQTSVSRLTPVDEIYRAAPASLRVSNALTLRGGSRSASFEMPAQQPRPRLADLRRAPGLQAGYRKEEGPRTRSSQGPTTPDTTSAPSTAETDITGLPRGAQVRLVTFRIDLARLPVRHDQNRDGPAVDLRRLECPSVGWEISAH